MALLLKTPVVQCAGFVDGKLSCKLSQFKRFRDIFHPVQICEVCEEKRYWPLSIRKCEICSFKGHKRCVEYETLEASFVNVIPFNFDPILTTTKPRNTRNSGSISSTSSAWVNRNRPSTSSAWVNRSRPSTSSAATMNNNRNRPSTSKAAPVKDSTNLSNITSTSTFETAVEDDKNTTGTAIVSVNDTTSPLSTDEVVLEVDNTSVPGTIIVTRVNNNDTNAVITSAAVTSVKGDTDSLSTSTAVKSVDYTTNLPSATDEVVTVDEIRSVPSVGTVTAVDDTDVIRQHESDNSLDANKTTKKSKRRKWYRRFIFCFLIFLTCKC
ncbi:uncharacterized protein LOC114121317 [Aphis gossypii]|uniref:uncharacterized protein LOC114121317 n=1 Tax=Aphis gossypii TaxID=80765 RepID=UPI00215998CA|nr:uncharacterized protein LOC114121317 [Aphis gossypii]